MSYTTMILDDVGPICWSEPPDNIVFKYDSKQHAPWVEHARFRLERNCAEQLIENGPIVCVRCERELDPSWHWCPWCGDMCDPEVGIELELDD